jgi:hypothetical protein
MKLTSKSTKAEILAGYEALAAQQATQYVTWPLVVNTARRVWSELQALVRDVYRLGAHCRKGVDSLLAQVVQ